MEKAVTHEVILIRDAAGAPLYPLLTGRSNSHCVHMESTRRQAAGEQKCSVVHFKMNWTRIRKLKSKYQQT